MKCLGWKYKTIALTYSPTEHHRPLRFPSHEQLDSTNDNQHRSRPCGTNDPSPEHNISMQQMQQQIITIPEIQSSFKLAHDNCQRTGTTEISSLFNSRTALENPKNQPPITNSSYQQQSATRDNLFRFFQTSYAASDDVPSQASLLSTEITLFSMYLKI